MFDYEEWKSAIEALENEDGEKVDPWFLIELAIDRRVERFRQTLDALKKFDGEVSKITEAGYSMKELLDATSWEERPRRAAIIKKSQALENEIGKKRAVERYKTIIRAFKKSSLDRAKVIDAGTATSGEEISCAIRWYNENLLRRRRRRRRRQQDTAA